MTLPTSGNLSLADIIAEFGAPANTKLSQLVRGGAYVPDTPANAGVPTAVPISLRDFLGASAVSIVVSSSPANVYVYNNSSNPGGVLLSGGVTITATGGSGTYTYTWVFVSGDAGISRVSSGTPSGKVSTWSANVLNGATRSALWKVQVNDGFETVELQVAVDLVREAT